MFYENSMTKAEYERKSIEQYMHFDYSDPQTTTDASLFGKWDGNAWTMRPLLDYESVPELDAVKNAVFQAMGDYTVCKETLFDYYKKKFDNFHLEPHAAECAGKDIWLTAQMQFENFQVRPRFGPCPIDKVLVDRNPQWLAADVGEAVRECLTTGDKKLTIHLYALKKDGYMAQFDSRRGQKQPFIELVINNEVHRFYGVADTYVSAGANRFKNFGREKVLLVEESFTSIHKPETVDEYTRRSILKFDFSQLQSNTAVQISAGKLYLYGFMKKSDNPVESGIEKQSKTVFVMNVTSGNMWQESSYVWDDLSAGGWVCFSYDGTAGCANRNMSKYFTEFSGFFRASIMGFSHDIDYFIGYYEATGNETVAYHVLRLIMHRIRELHCQFDVTEQPTLNMIRCQILIKAMIKLRNSVYMTPEIFVTFLKSAYEHGEAIVGSERFYRVREKIWASGLKYTNIGALQTSALLELGVVFDEFKAANAPLAECWALESWNGGWKAVAKHRFELLVENSVYEDGSVSDGPLSYLWVNLRNYITPLKTYYERYHCDISEIFPDVIKEKLIRGATFVSNMLSPFLGTWHVGDAEYYLTKQNSYIKDICELWPKEVSEVAQYIGSDRRFENPPKYTSCVSDTSRRAVLRSNWEADGVAMCIQANSDLNHTHQDDLAVTLAAYGNYLLVDLNRYMYKHDDRISLWQSSPEGHNTVSIVGVPSAKKGGSLHPEDREFAADYDYLHADMFGYDDYDIERYVCFVKPEYFIITDHVRCKTQEKYKAHQNWHFQPDAGIAWEENGGVKTHYISKANLLVIPAAEPEEVKGEIRTGYYSRHTNRATVENHRYVSFEKEAYGNISFQTLLYPVRTGKKVNIQVEKLPVSLSDEDARAMSATILDEAGNTICLYFYQLLNIDKQQEVVFGEHRTDGTMALVEYRNGEKSRVILRGGSYIE